MPHESMRPCDYDDGYDDDPVRIEMASVEQNSWKQYLDRDFFDKFIAHLERRLKLTPLCESPIEIDLGAALIALLSGQYIVAPQFKLGRYRYDFSISSTAQSKPVMLVECDSRQFHQTNEQLANDRAKDKAASSAGILLVRVRGTDIYRDPFAVARFVIGQIP